MTERSIEYRRLDAIVPAPRNSKLHALDDIRSSLTRFGYTEPLLLDERTGRLVAGHGRLETLAAARAGGLPAPEGITVEDGQWLVPIVRGWASADDAEAEAYLVASNRLVEAGGWDDGVLADMLVDLRGTTAGLAGVGFDDAALDELLASLGRDVPVQEHTRHIGDPDDVPEVPEVPVTKPGDLWLLGPHRLLCGDATVRADYDRVLGGEHPVGAVVTDPPYGVGIGAKNRALDAIDRADRVLTDLEGDQGIEEVEALWKASFACIIDVMPKGTPYYMTGPQGGDLGLLLLLLLRDAGLAPRHILIWVKNRPSFSIGRLDYDYQHEPIIYGWKPGAGHPWYAKEQRVSTMFVDRPQASPNHPTTKPVDLFRPLIENSTPPGGMVLDPFMGSGTTIVAADQCGRRAFGLEISPHYVDVALARWQGLTGEKPVLESSGEPFDFLAE